MLGFSPLSSSPISALADSGKAFQANLTVTASSNPALLVTKPLSSSVSVTATVNVSLSIGAPLQSAISATANTTTTLALSKLLSSSLSVTANTNATLLLNKPLSSSVSVTATVTPNLTLVNNNATTISTVATATPNLTLVNNLAANVVATNILATVLNVDKLLQSQLSVTADTVSNVTLTHSVVGQLTSNATTNAAAVLTHNLSASASVIVSALLESVYLESFISVTGSATANISVTKNLSSNIFDRASIGNITPTPAAGENIDFIMSGAFVPPDSENVDFTLYYTDGTAKLDLTNSLSANSVVSGSIAGLLTTELATNSLVSVDVVAPLFVEKLRANLQVTAESNSNLEVTINLSGGINSLVTTTPELQQTIALSGSLIVDTDIMVGIPVKSSVTVAVLTAALLDIDGNTEGSPGGVPVDGFYPPTSVILANHSESAAAASYTITADIEPGYTTEIIDVYVDVNPNNVIELSYNGGIVTVFLNTPREVYGMSSTFTISRSVEPQFNVEFNYNLQLNTTITNNSRGNNFRSNKFYIYGNESPCFLRDDGAGFVTLFEESEPGLIKKLRDVGFINYSTGELSVSALRITRLVEAFLEFSATSLNNIVPTTDYFDSKNSLLVQSKTVAFPTGEAVEIYQYSKAEELIDVYITVVARAYNPLAPEITVDQREAVYKLTVLPDYNIGKDKLQQLLQAA